MPERLSIVVPVYNERETVVAVLDRLRTIQLPIPREIIVVNDGSSDGTREALDAVANPDGTLTIIHLPKNRGKGFAVRTGLEKSTGTITAIQDADLELDPAQLAALIVPILEGRADTVYGSRFLGPQAAAIPLVTKVGNLFLTWVTNALFGQRLTDMETCYKVMRGDLARSLTLTADRFDIEPEITAQLCRRGRQILELPVRFSPRAKSAGKKIRWHDGIHAVRVLLRQRFGGETRNPTSCTN